MRVVLLLIAAACVAAPAAAQGIRIDAQAGLGGLARAGRWLPVRLTVENTGADITGELVIEWGDARLHRPIALASPSRTQFESYLRTLDVRDRIVIRLIAGGETIATAEAPVRVAGDDEAVHVCVTSSGLDGGAGCTSTIRPQAMPQSMRGYDAADVVTWPGTPSSGATAVQRMALRRWQVRRTLEDRDLLSSGPHATWDAASAGVRPAGTVLAAAVVYAAALTLAAIVWVRRRRPVMRSYAAMAAAIVVATAATASAGRVGPGSAIVLRQATTVEQVGDGSIVTMRGRLIYPAFDDYAVTASVADGAIVPAFGATSEQWVDERGMPLRRGTRARGAVEDVAFEGLADYAPFRITWAGTFVRVANVSNHPLESCRFGDGSVRTVADTLAPGAAVELRPEDGGDAPWLACRIAASPVHFTDPRFAVHEEGPVIVTVALAPVAAGGGTR